MKKLMFAVGLGLISGSLWAACMGPYCYDDTGATIGGFGYNGNGIGIPSASSTTIAGIVPSLGQMIMCTSCANTANPSGRAICYSTGTLAGSFVIAVSTIPVCK